MTAVAAYIALVVVIPALGLGHQGQHWPLRGAWKWLYARLPASRAPKVPRVHPAPERPSCARTVPSWAHTEPYTYEEAA